MAHLTIHEHPELENPRMLLGFSGWMDGGHVSTGIISYLSEKLRAMKLAEIDGSDFSILHFPVAAIPIAIVSDRARAIVSSVDPMEFAAIFRPHTRIEDGIIKELTWPTNEFAYSQAGNLILFSGQEPHIRWREYCECIFAIAEEFGVREFHFAGSVASPIPHTREPRIRASVSSEELKQTLVSPDITFTDYEGPAGIVTLLAERCPDKSIAMSSLVVDVPHYPFLDLSTYPKSILKVTSVLNELLQLDIGLLDLRESAARTEDRLNEVMAENPEFHELVARLEEAYDYEEAIADEEVLRQLIEGIDLGGDERKN